MAGKEEPWTLYDASQNLAAVLNDPNRGKQSNFFTKTWGDAFVERTDIEKSAFLPEITYAHFDTYLKKIGRRLRRHRRLSQSKSESSLTSTQLEPSTSNDPSYSSEGTLDDVPEIFKKSAFPLNSPELFNAVFPHIEKGKSSQDSDRMVQEELSHYLDIVEVQIAKQVSQKSDAFFHAMTSHDTIMEQMSSACLEVRTLRAHVQRVDRDLAQNSLRALALARRRANQGALLDKLRLMSTVLQTQPTLQLLLSAPDYVAALELIAGTQEVLSRELAGVTSLRHLPSQLKEMSKLIDKMLSTEFERYAAADLHRPPQTLLNGDVTLLDTERLVSLVAGLLRQSHLKFLEIYRAEALSAAQTLLKQLLIQELANAERADDDTEHRLTGSGEDAETCMDVENWLRVVGVATEALGKLVKHVRAVHDVIKQTAAISAGLVPVPTEASADGDMQHLSHLVTSTENFLSLEEHNRVEIKLKELLVSICDYCHERLAAIVSNQSDKQVITASQIATLAIIVDHFTATCTALCGRPSPALRAAFKVQAGDYVHRFHAQRKEKLDLVLVSELWRVTDVPTSFQQLLDDLAAGKVGQDSLQMMGGGANAVDPDGSSSILPFHTSTTSTQTHLHTPPTNEPFVAVGAVLILVRLVCEYCACATSLPTLSTAVFRHLVELIRTFNSRAYQLVLGAGALRTTDLRTITSTNLALCSRALQLVLWMLPRLQAHFDGIVAGVDGNTGSLSGLHNVQTDIVDHIQQLETKILAIMNTLLTDQLKDWDAKPPVPSKAFRNISKHLTKLHEAVSSVLPEKQVNYIYQTVHTNFKKRLRDQIVRMNIQNNGGTQHGVVTSELTFYLETMKNLRVLAEKHSLDNTMDDIWR